MITLDEIRQAREWGVREYRTWKDAIRRVDRIAGNDWEILWPDDALEPSDPLVENIYTQALEDKGSVAASVMPSLIVPAARGTRADRAEANAQKRRRAMAAYWERSRLDYRMTQFTTDWLHCGAWYSMAWSDFHDQNGRELAPNERFPYFVRFDPRQALPLAHNSLGIMTAVMFARKRRASDIIHEYGAEHPAVRQLSNMATGRTIEPGDWLEEVWFADESNWAVAIGVDRGRIVSISDRDRHDQPLNPDAPYEYVWVMEPEKHRMSRCPVVETKRTTHDDAYRGALEDILSSLKVGQNFMARLLDDLNDNIYGAVVLDNIENPEDYGPGAVLQGNGQGQANIVRDRAPVNFEALTVVREQIDQARRQAAQPQQRSGDFGASIASAKGVNAVIGAFNSELAWMQRESADGLQRQTSLAAEFDEKWCYGPKEISGFEGGREFTESYDAERVFAGDWRCKVTYGDRTGLDEHNYLVRLSTVFSQGGMSLRSFMEKSGFIEDTLQEERDVAIEALSNLFMQQILPQQIQGGDLGALKAFVDKIDDDKLTTRAAVLETIKELTAPQPQVGGGLPEQGQGNNPTDPILQARSLLAGGRPGNAEGLPPPGQALSGFLPAGVGRALGEVGPGGTAT